MSESLLELRENIWAAAGNRINPRPLALAATTEPQPLHSHPDTLSHFDKHNASLGMGLSIASKR